MSGENIPPPPQPAALTEEQKAAVLKQVEFYFGDSNLPKDRFLKEKVAADPEGFVDLKLICSFSRMREHLKLNAPTPAAVPDAIRDAVSDILRTAEDLVVAADGTRVRRAVPLGAPRELIEAIDRRSLVVRPFPESASLDAVTSFFEGTGKVRAVRLRRDENKLFKGSAMIEFDTEEEAQRVAGLQLSYAGAPLRMQPKLDYLRSQAGRPLVDIRAGPSRPSSPLRIPQDVLEAIPKEPEAPAAPAQASLAEYERGIVLRFRFVDPADTAAGEGGAAPRIAALSYDLISGSLGGKQAGVGYVKYEQGGSEGLIRFHSAEQAKAAAEQERDAEGFRLLGGFKAKLDILEGDEERAFHEERAREREGKAAATGGRGGRGGGRGGRGGFGFGRGGGRGGGGRGGGGRGGRGGAPGGRGGHGKRDRDGGSGGRGDDRGGKRGRH